MGEKEKRYVAAENAGHSRSDNEKGGQVANKHPKKKDKRTVGQVACGTGEPRAFRNAMKRIAREEDVAINLKTAGRDRERKGEEDGMKDGRY